MSKPRKDRINEITGYRKDASIEFLYVSWKNSKPSWEAIEDIMSYEEVNKFITILEKYNTKLKTEKKEREQKNELEALLTNYKENKRKKDLEENKLPKVNILETISKKTQSFGLANVKDGQKTNIFNHELKSKSSYIDSVKNLYNGQFKRDKLNINKYDNFDSKDNNNTKNIKYESSTQSNLSYEKRFPKEEKRSVIGFNDKKIVKNYDIKPPVNLTDGIKTHPFIETIKDKNEIARLTSDEISQKISPGIIRGHKRYFQIDEPVKPFTKKIIDNSPIQVKNEINVFVQGTNIATFNDIVNITDDYEFNIKSLNFNKFVSTKTVNNLIFTSRQNINTHYFDIYRAFMSNSVAALDSWYYKMKTHSYCLVDDTGLLSVYILCLVTDFVTNYILNYDYVILKIDKKLFCPFDKFTNAIENSIFDNRQQWNINKYLVTSMIENLVLYNFSENQITNNKTYILYAAEDNKLAQNLHRVLQNDDFKKGDPDTENIDYVFLHEKNVSLLNTIINIDTLLIAKTKFYTFSFEKYDYNNMNIFKPILQIGGIVTFSVDIVDHIQDLEDLDKVLKQLQSIDSKWICRISKTMLQEFESKTYKYNRTMRSKDMECIVDWLKTCIENIDSYNELDFITKCQEKYFHEKRHFYIISNNNSGYKNKTPVEIYKYMSVT
ncbi:hypothetical protein COBT_001089 [Conglomerata obtusa]